MNPLRLRNQGVWHFKINENNTFFLDYKCGKKCRLLIVIGVILFLALITFLITKI